MKLASHLAAALLGLVFLIFSVNFFFHFFELPVPPAGSPPALFLGAVIPTGYFTFVKMLELAGGVLVVVPRTRALGLLILGPIVVNILCFDAFLTHGAGMSLGLLVGLLSLFLLWVNRAAFAPILRGAK
ncbi:MAG TPA: hypothetical protein VKC60_10005 [Opitutaceae bacterium]|nr:hypothetical protein [Opitutaceae bacterium]